MSFEQSEKNNQESIKTPNNREGLDKIFKKNPELAEIGTLEKYSQYLDTIFPDSKFTGIAYHGTREPFTGDAFNTDKKTNARNFGNGIYFSPHLDKPEIYAGKEGEVISTILNIKDPFITDNTWSNYYGCDTLAVPDDIKITELTNGQDTILNYRYLDRDNFKKINDYIIEYIGETDESKLPAYQKEIYRKPELEEIVVGNPDYIHILGSEKDIAGFKNFIAEEKQENSE